MLVPTPQQRVRPNTVKLQEIPEGTDGTKATVRKIVEVSVAGATEWDIISLARMITYQAKPRANRDMADKIYWWLKNNIKFVRDPIPAELVQSPKITLQTGYGDCDDLVGAFCALCLSVGIPVRYITIASEEGNYNYSHIYVEAQDEKGDWVPYDPSYPEGYPGWAPPRYHRKAIWTLEGDFVELSGWLKDTWEHIEDEVNRVWDRIQDEMERFNNRVDAEINRFAEKNDMGGFTQLLSFGAKLFMMQSLSLLSGGLLAPLTTMFLPTFTPGTAGPLFTMTPYTPSVSWAASTALNTASFAVMNPVSRALMLQSFDNPWSLTEDEWEMLGKLALTFASGILTILSGGAAAPLLTSTVLSLINTAWSLMDIEEDLQNRRDMIDQLEREQAQFDMEARAQREAMNKLLADIEALEWYLTRQKQAELELEQYKLELKAQLEAEAVAQQEGFMREINRYKKELAEDTQRYMVDYETKNLYQHARPVTAADYQNQLETTRIIEQTRQRGDLATAITQAPEQILDIPIEADTKRNDNAPWRQLINQERFTLFN